MENGKKNISSSTTAKPDFTDVTILATPLPQATSTIERKSTLPPRYGNINVKSDNCKRSIMNDSIGTHDSSLGILENISLLLDDNLANADDVHLNRGKDIKTERELARMLLKKCSAPLINPQKEGTKFDKENDANVQNVMSNAEQYDFLNSSRLSQNSLAIDEVQNESTLTNSNSKTTLATANVVFEPSEITACSSEMSGTSENLFENISQPSNIGGLSFNSTAAEIMAQFAGEEFQTDSRIINQMIADDAPWQQNYPYSMPLNTNNEKEHLNLSCFSGIIGDFDLTADSCAGRKISIGEFFKRKCGNIGNISTAELAQRPSLGFSIKSPKQREKLEPLIDMTGETAESTFQKDTTNKYLSNTVDENSLMSLSSIAQVLQNADNATPRRLVDQLIMARKKKKQQSQEQKVISDTYAVLPSPRTHTIEAQKSDIKTTTNDQKSERTLTPKIKENISETSFPALKPTARTSTLLRYDDSPKELKPPFEKHASLQHIYIKKGSPIKFDTKQGSSFSKETPPKQVKMKNEDFSINTDSVPNPSGSNLSYYEGKTIDNQNVVIGKKTQELCTCVVGIKKETDIDISNNGDRWIICSISLSQIQGDSDAIELMLPSDRVLIEPDACKIVKIQVKVLRMITPIIAVLDVLASDFVTHSKWSTKYMICFVPEELEINVITPSQDKELDFQSITEDGSNTLSVTLKNQNCVDLPVVLHIVQNEPTTFRLNRFVNEMASADNHNSRTTSLVLKSRQQCTVDIEFRGAPLNLLSAESGNSLLHVKAKFVVHVPSDSENDHGKLVDEIPLIGSIGFYRVKLVDTKLPITIPKMQKKLLTLVNSGNIGVLLSAAIVENESKGSEKPCNDFTLSSTTLFLGPKEKGSFAVSYMPRHSSNMEGHAMVKIISGSNKYLYPVIGENNFATEEASDTLRCDTPQMLKAMNSSNSPCNRSPHSGRDSPGSWISASTVAGDAIPIRATHSSLAWSSVRVGKSETKEIKIRNTSTSKIKLHAVIVAKERNFKLTRDRQTTTNTLVLTLKAAESKTLSVIFNPLSPGAAAGKLSFQHYCHTRDSTESRSPKVVPLYGYGGSTKLEISKAYKDTGGQIWLSLGKMTGGSLDAKIKLENSGDLTCYVKLKLEPKAVYPSMAFSWSVEPTELLLGPNEAQWVSLEFRPRKEDLHLLNKSTVSHVGTLKFTYGDEPTRRRIRRLFNKAKESGQESRKGDEFWNVVHPICKSFPGETFIRDLTVIRDTNLNLGDLCRGVHQQELKLTVETNADETMSMLQDDMDDTQTFYSLCTDTCNEATATGESFLPSESVLDTGNRGYCPDFEETFIVQPSSIILNPLIKNDATVVLSTSCKVAQPFETVLLNSQNYLTVVPSTGMIPTGRSLPLKIECKRHVTQDFDAILRICTANDRRNVPIRICVRKK